MKVSCLSFAVVVSFLGVSAAQADVITSLGNTTSTLVSGNIYTSATILSAQSGQAAPFNAPCGSDASANCVASWTFTYSLAAGQTVDGATLTLGIFDIDSKQALDEVGSFTLTGGDDLTSALNTAANAPNGGTGSKNNEYDVLSITIPGTSFTALDSGSATFNLALQGPGIGVLGKTTFNGAALIFSTLDLQTQTVSSTPEPSMIYLLLAGIGGILLLRVRARKAS